ncbi:MAG: cytochrome c3 family protein [Bacteroidetes bacterium]|nr:cytochrome c3 family protein [Bacteroidota bacterium]
MILFFFFGILMALAVVDLIFTRKIKHRAIHVLILLTGLAVQTQMAVTEAQNLGRTRHYAPDQPIKFSHKVHAGQNRIDCKYCHTGVFAGKSAGIPSPNLCMNCHFVVKSGRNSGRFEINKIAEALKTGKPIEWIRIHSLPEYAYFNHSQHVMVGSVSCQQCHGPVENMDIIYQYADLSMGWCVNCHRQTKVQADYNPYYQNNKKLQELVKSGKLKSLTVEEIGGLDCMKCHY